MSTSYPILLSAFLAIFLASGAEVSAQSSGDQTRPRALTDSESPNVARQFTSSEAMAEAKRLYKAGVQYGDAGLFSQAANLFEQALKLNPNYADAYASLGHAYFDMKQWDKAIPTLEQALVLNPKNKEARNRLASAKQALEAERNSPEQQSQPATPEETTTTNRTPTGTRVAADDGSLIKVYRVGPGDVLDVRLGESSTGTFTVGTSGLLEHPNLSQPLPVGGRTVEEIADRIQSTLTASAAALNAKVSVTVTDYASHRILVSGLVKEPGPKIIRREAIPLTVVIADAQRLPEATIAKIVRSETNETFTVELANDTQMNFLVRPGDVVTLEAEPAQFFYVGGEVKAPGEKTFRRGLTLTQAILSAGGLSGKPKEVRLSRDSGNGFLVMTRYKLQEIESGKRPDPVIQPGDRITVVK